MSRRRVPKRWIYSGWRATSRATRRPLFNTGAFVGEGIPTFEIRDFQESGDLIIKTPHLGASLAKVLGPKPAAIL